jgi:hypothetical protein
MLRDRDRPFTPEMRGAILSGCPDRAPAWASCPMISTSSVKTGRVSPGHRSATSRAGPSPTIGRIASRSRTPSWRCSRLGSVTSLISSLYFLNFGLPGSGQRYRGEGMLGV